jgi:uncharacterized protein (TIGR02246 family)
MRFSSLFFPFALIVVQGVAVSAAMPPRETAQLMLDRYLAAWSRADASAMAAVYAPEGEFIPPGAPPFHGRQAIADFYRMAFDRGYAGSQGAASFSEVTALGAEVILARGTWSIEGAASAAGPRSKECGSFLLALQRHEAKDGWRVAFLQETGAACGP